jgi:hypothetical protein
VDRPSRGKGPDEGIDLGAAVPPQPPREGEVRHVCWCHRSTIVYLLSQSFQRGVNLVAVVAPELFREQNASDRV